MFAITISGGVIAVTVVTMNYFALVAQANLDANENEYEYEYQTSDS
jgi:hypothetical protein